MNHLAGEVRLKNQQKWIYNKSCQDIIELSEIRDGLASCDILSNDDICKIIDIICIEYYLLYYSIVFIESTYMLCIAGLGSSTVDQVLKYTKYPKHLPSTSTGQVLIFLKST